MLTAISGGLGALLYIVMWIMLPIGEAVEGENRPKKRFYLSEKDKKIGGVCGGLGEFFAMDSTMFRISFIVSAFIGGIGILLYLILWLVAPRGSSI